jgi:coenzyme PQQ precursor peptide PqqA
MPLAGGSLFALFLVGPRRVRARSGCALRGDEQLFELKIGIEETIMAWTTPTLVEICIGLEINGYLPAEF